MGEKRKIKYSVPQNATVTVYAYVDATNPEKPRVLTPEDEASLPHTIPADVAVPSFALPVDLPDAAKAETVALVTKAKVAFYSRFPVDHAKLPENIVVEWSKWAEPTWGIHAWIDEQSWSKKSVDPRAGREFDIMRYMRARVRALLVDWSLSESDPEMKLTRATESLSDGTPVQFLHMTSLLAVARCNPDIVNVFYSKAMSKLYPTEEESKN